jgi:hypothetical protein
MRRAHARARHRRGRSAIASISFKTSSSTNMAIFSFRIGGAVL